MVSVTEDGSMEFLMKLLLLLLLIIELQPWLVLLPSNNVESAI
jgi:hypothetical protein